MTPWRTVSEQEFIDLPSDPTSHPTHASKLQKSSDKPSEHPTRSPPQKICIAHAALESGNLRLLRIVNGISTVWAMSAQSVTAMVRDFFDGFVYGARSDSSILRYSTADAGKPFQTVNGAARISAALD